MASSEIFPQRLRRDQPILLGADFGSTLGNSPLDVAVLPRNEPQRVRAFHQQYVAAGAQMLFALTSDTTRVALDELGMGYRAAAITSAAVELAHEAASDSGSPILVAGVLASAWSVSNQLHGDELRRELIDQAARLAAAEVDVLVVRARPASDDGGPAVCEATRWAAEAAGKSGVPSVLLAPIANREEVERQRLSSFARIAREASLDGLLLDVPSVEHGRFCYAELARDAEERGSLPVGFILDAAPADDPTLWADHAGELLATGAFALGGGRGTSAAHIRALGERLSRSAAERLH